MNMNCVRFDGSDFIHGLDGVRLNSQIRRVFNAMKYGDWKTLNEVADETGDPHASISAQLRNLRKPRFGGYIIEKRRRGDDTDGLFEYRLTSRNKIEVQGDLFA